MKPRHKFIKPGDEKDPPISEEALAQMRERTKEGTRWAAYQNVALDSADLGGLRFLHVGIGCTFTEPPERYPDTKLGTGWRHFWVGWADLTTGEIVEE